MRHVAPARAQGTASVTSTDLDRAARVVDELGRVLASPPRGADELSLRRLRDELSSHVLAARVLIDAGASRASIAPLLRRATEVIDEVGAVGSSSEPSTTS